MIWFEAKAGSAEQLDDLNSFAVILAEELDGSGRRLEIQKALVSDEQDRALGMDTYCLCTETGATHYGGIISWAIEKDLLKIRLDKEASLDLGIQSHISIALRIGESEIAVVRSGLERILIDSL